MDTRIGVYLFLGLILGTVLGQWTPFAASLEALTGGVIGVAIGFIADRVRYNRRQDN